MLRTVTSTCKQKIVRSFPTSLSIIEYPRAITIPHLQTISTPFSHNFGTLTHITTDNQQQIIPTMVDISSKSTTLRYAIGQGKLYIPLIPSRIPINIKTIFTTSDLSTLSSTLLMERTTLFSTAITAGTLGTKYTSNLIPMCHPLPIQKCHITITSKEISCTSSLIPSHIKDLSSSLNFTSVIELLIQCKVTTLSNTGIEMEALTGTSITLLTLYDMLKNNIPHSLLHIHAIEIIEKLGGKSGHYIKDKSILS